MVTVTLTQLRNNAKKYFDDVENGETLEVYRHGKPIAKVMPVGSGVPAWKRDRPLIKLAEGVSASRMIIAEREEGW